MADLKSQLEISADASGVETGVNQAKRSLASLGQSAAAAGKQSAQALGSVADSGAQTTQKIDAATRSLTNSIQRQIAAMEAGGKSTSDYYRLLASQRGIDAGGLTPYLNQLDRLNAKQAALGQTAGQTANALRSVPAQATDIVTSLAGGQDPLLVLLQQGGQLKDMFGGVGAAARAMGGYLLGLINPFTLAAAGAGTLFLAYEQGRKESVMLEQTLLKTGGILGATAGQLNEMAQALDGQGFTRSAAASALAQIATTGAVASKDLQDFTKTAMDMERLVGTPVDETAKAFKSLGDEPAKAALKLNESLHFLTLAQYEQIKSLEEAGQKTDAARVAQQAYADALKPIIANAEQNIGYLERAWAGVAKGAKEAWDSMLDVGRQVSLEDRLSKAQQLLADYEKTPAGKRTTEQVATMGKAGGVDALKEQILGLQELIANQRKAAEEDARRQRVQEAGTKAFDAVSLAQGKGLTKQQQLNKALTDYRENLDKIRAATPNSALLDPAKIKAGEDALRKQYKEDKPKVYTEDSGSRMLANLKEQEAALRVRLSSEVGLNTALQEQAKFEAQIADIKGKTQLTAEQKALLAAQDRIRAQLAVNVGIEREIELKTKAQKAEEERAKALAAVQNRADGIRRTMADRERGQAEQYDDQLSVIGLGSEAAERLRSRQQIERQYATLRRQLTEEAAKNQLLESEAYRTGVTDIEASLQRALQANETYYAAVGKLQGSWELGVSSGLANYASGAANVFKQTETLVTKAFGGMEDALVNFAMTGKLSFGDMAKSIISDILRIYYRSQLLNMLGAGSGGGGGILQTVIGAALGSYASGAIGVGMANALPGDSLSNFIDINKGFGTVPGRASGGPVNAGSLYQVNELGPELLSVGGRDYLMMGAQSGQVTPNAGAGGSAGQGELKLTIINNTSAPIGRVTERITPTERALIVEEAVAATAGQFGDPNSKTSKSLGAHYALQRRR